MGPEYHLPFLSQFERFLRDRIEVIRRTFQVDLLKAANTYQDVL